MRCCLLALAALLPLSARAQTARETFAGHVITFETPSGFSPSGRQSPDPAALFLRYWTPPRSDCRNAVALVTLVDLPATAGGDTLTARQFAATMIGPVERARDQWSMRESVIVVDGDSAVRYEWSASSRTRPRCPPAKASLPVHGVMIAGIREKLGFGLRVEDFDPEAAATVPAGEAGLRTFRVDPQP